MKALDCWKIINSEKLGTVVEIQLLFNEEPTSVSISVFDSASVEKVDDATATEDDNLGRFFTYEYQSSLTDLEGWYKFTVQAVIGGKTYYDYFKFFLKDAEAD